MLLIQVGLLYIWCLTLQGLLYLVLLHVKQAVVSQCPPAFYQPSNLPVRHCGHTYIQLDGTYTCPKHPGCSCDLVYTTQWNDVLEC